MSPITSTVWPIKPHTVAKHEILRNYLKAWFPILSRWSGRIIYLDGFAGPGVYTGGESGSPLIALQTAVEHKLRHRFKEIVFLFIEKEPERATKLEEVLKERFPNLPANMKYQIIGAEFAPTLENTLRSIEQNGARLAPTFAFLDPFGFSGFPMKLIGRMMNYEKCEILITFMVGFVRRFTDKSHEPALNELYATEAWKEIHSISDPERRERFLLNLYENQLKKVGKTRYVRSFGMIGVHNQPIYYLVFGTKHLRGLEVMKDAMWSVDQRGIYRFSDLTDVNQTYIIDYQIDAHWVPKAASMVHDNFKGRTVGEGDIHEFVVADTPYRYKKSILRYLESECSPPKICSVRGRKRKLCFPKGCRITFSG